MTATRNRHADDLKPSESTRPGGDPTGGGVALSTAGGPLTPDGALAAILEGLQGRRESDERAAVMARAKAAKEAAAAAAAGGGGGGRTWQGDDPPVLAGEWLPPPDKHGPLYGGEEAPPAPRPTLPPPLWTQQSTLASGHPAPREPDGSAAKAGGESASHRCAPVLRPPSSPYTPRGRANGGLVAQQRHRVAPSRPPLQGAGAVPPQAAMSEADARSERERFIRSLSMTALPPGPTRRAGP